MSNPNIAKLESWLTGPSRKEALAQVLRGRVDTDYFVRVAVNLYGKPGSPLAQCDPISVYTAIWEAATLGLSIDPRLGEMWIIPRKAKGQQMKQATPQIGVQGLVKLARRSGQVLSIAPEVVYRGDDFAVRLGTERTIHHVPSMEAERTEENIIAVYAVARLANGVWDFRYMPRSDIERAADASAYNGERQDSWAKHFTGMALTRVVGRLCKWLPHTDELAIALDRDARRDRGEDVEPLVDTSGLTVQQRGAAGLNAIVGGGDDPEFHPPEEAIDTHAEDVNQ